MRNVFSCRQAAGLLASLLLVAAPAFAQAPPGCCTSRYPAAARPTTSLHQLGQEYRRLRGLGCDECQHYHSDLQRVLEALGTRLSGRPVAEVRQVLGPPDVVRQGRLVYYWRGEHDYLYFSRTPAGKAVAAWYYAYE